MLKINPKILDGEGLQKIHEAALDILETLGVRINHKDVYRRVIEAGALPGPSETAAFFPKKLVMDCLAAAPKNFDISLRSGKKTNLRAGGGAFYLTGNALNRTETGNDVKPISKEDFADFTRLTDNLENVSGMVGTYISGVPAKARDVVGFRIMLENTRKHMRPCLFSADGARVIMEMADIANEGRPYAESPFYSFGYSVVSPLQWSFEACEIFQKTSGHKIPLTINSEPLAGGTSPVTLAGSLALGDAEVLSGIVINEIIEPGRPVIYNIGFAHLLDMYSALALTGAPENCLLAAAGAELAEFYGLPSASWFGTDSLAVDSQSGIEKMIGILTHGMGGANFVWGVGNIEATKCFSPVMAVLDNEMIGMAERFERGIDVNAETLALGVIKEVGFSGDYLSAEHTLENFKSENRYDVLMTRANRDRWNEAGKLTLEAKAEKTVRNILSKKYEPHIGGSQLEKIMKIEKKWIETLS